MAEIHRVLRPQGWVYAETPFLQNVHEGAYDFTRFTESGHRWLFRRFSCVDSGVVGGPGTQVVWSLTYFVGALTRQRKIRTLIRALLSPIARLDRFIPRQHQTDSAAGVYFLGQASSQSITARDIVNFYPGVG